jgi:predicted AAA+ superfamily ATPase
LEYANFKIKGNLEKFILNWAKDKKVKHYVLLDEIHMMESFAFFLSSIRHYDFLDIYVTDSNTQTLLGKNAQILGGRYIQIKMYPLSFKEIMSDTDMKQDEAFKEYMIYGGFPRLTTIDQTMREDYLKQLLDSIIVNDVQAYAQIRNMNLFLHLVNYLSDNIGRETSNKRISDYISSNYQESHSGKTNETIDEYINALINANIIKRVNRFDIRGKEEFKMLPKYYFVDQGLVNARLGFHNIKKSYVLENIVFVELLRRECNV